MEAVGLRELRQNASDLIRRVEDGEEITITVSGRASAAGLAATKTWRRWADVEKLFRSGDPAWEADRDLVATNCAIRGIGDEGGILDTSAVPASGVEPIPGELALSAITLAELHVGVRFVAKTPDIRAERLRRLVQIEREFDALPSTMMWPTATVGWFRPSSSRAATAGAVDGPADPQQRRTPTARAFTPIPPTSSAWLTSSTSSRSERPRSLPFRQTSIDRRG